MENFIEEMFENKINMTIIVILIGIILYLIIKYFTNRMLKRNIENDKINKKRKTYIKLFNNIFKYLIMLIVVAIVLQIYGINVTSIAAGIGVISVIVGLALQDALKDIIMGFNIVIDNYFSVGDVLKVNNIEGKVTEIGLKSIKLRDIKTQNIYVIANRNVTDALVLSNQFDIDIPLPYEKKVTDVEIIIEEMLNEISKLEHVINAQYKGINEFGSSAINYKIRIFCNPELIPQIRRDANRIIKLKLDENKIDIPYTQIEIHSK